MNHTSPKPNRVNILGVPVDHVTMESTLQIVAGWIDQDPIQCHQICTPNPEFVMRAQQDADFLSILQQADLSIPDGIGLIYASGWYGNRLPERVPGSELVNHLARLCAQKGQRLFLLGAAEGVAARAAEIYCDRYPGLQIAGTWSGSPDPAENDAIVQKIVSAQTDVLYVAFGAPNQDKWIARNSGQLHGVKVAIGIGGSLDFVTGRITRAPRWVQKVHLEWLYRLWKEPWRWRRMLALPKFTLLALKQSQTQR